MKNYLEYKGYIGSVEYSDSDDCLFGKVMGIRSLISYEGQSVGELKQSFQYMIDEYLNDCKDANIEPEEPYKGSLNIRIDSDLHRSLAILAKSEHMTINAIINNILKKYLNNSM